MASVPFRRADLQSAARTFEKLFPLAEIRRRALEILHFSLAAAHEIDGANWGVTLNAASVRLNVGRGAALSFARQQVFAVCDERSLDKTALQKLQKAATIERGRFQTAPHALNIGFEAEKLAQLWPLIEKSHLDFVTAAAHGFTSRAPRSPTWRDAHSSGVLALLRRELGREIPNPSYAKNHTQNEASTPEIAPVFHAQQLLSSWMESRGLSFSPSHLAAFFTALSTKGLVILSGPSGVGKTALALQFAALLPKSGEKDAHFVHVGKESRADGQLTLPSAALRYLAVPQAGESRAVTVICEGAAYPARLVGDAKMGAATGAETGAAHLQLRGAARKWLLDAGELLMIESEWGEETLRPTFRLLRPPAEWPNTAANHLFLPVRPDWRDEKPLLGYFNPLANRYEWTPFLRFLLRADAGFERGDGLAYFVILDEMNLARPEWYFADFLSLLEAPRDASGRTAEPLRLDFDARATGELPPREIFLPPNLYFVGTINADESAGSLSPKVLDRAWVLEAPRPDFRAYSPSKNISEAESEPKSAPKSDVSEAQKSELLALFTRRGQFTAVDKAMVAAQIAQNPHRPDALADLNDALAASGAGFGFRVFDEIFTFCALAGQNGLFESEQAAFDCAVSLKIVPLFRGARGQIEGALKAILAWSEARQLVQSASAVRKLLLQLERDGYLP